ncbi:gamma-glutamyl kinase [Phaeobacter sp. 22II1-1F12B]|uniref:gamma-glutamyl kinase n=1 Tax=Phaeobacter sp. 22II1-1F12B TaxID=1317111 RepID=UPI000B52789D|nr:gamma-glutamyl kinase [Phaeobacter sp. 22II1-1F12B]OWU73202.1 gamma-glutamyl kinase [Phaeobacter sp. 22II1-1F12B]
MLVFVKERLAFLAVPKTGTTAYHAALAQRADMVVSNPPELKHAPLYRYDRFFRPMFEKTCNAELETLAVMREPISWLGSWYRYRQRPYLDGKPASTRDISFDEFVEAYMRGDKPPFANVGSQARFLAPRPNGTAITHLFRYEDPAPLNHFLTERLNCDLDLQQHNTSPRADLPLSPKVEQKFRRKFAAEFEVYESIGA